jgi:integral membrane protein (TIGR00529 family)
MEVFQVSFVNPLLAFAISIALFVVLMYRRVGLGISLTVAAFLMSLLSLGISGTATALAETCLDQTTLTLVFASFFIILLSILYSETGLVNVLTRSLGAFIKNSKLIVSLLPAVIGLLPVAGAALMSAPMVEAEADKLGLDKSKKTYINIWFRHAILPIYPISQFLILTVALTGTSIDSLIARQAPIVAVMIIVGYFVGLRKAKVTKNADSETELNQKANLKGLAYSFLPIIITIILTAALNVNIAISTLVGVITILAITKTKLAAFKKVLKNRAIWEVTLAAFAALLLRNVTMASGTSQILGSALASTNLNEIVTLSVVPAALGFLLGSPTGAMALSVPILAETVTFIPKNVSLIYISAYLGYLGAPTHLCLVFTAQYFKTSITKSYKYLIPSIIVSMTAALITYLLL